MLQLKHSLNLINATRLLVLKPTTMLDGILTRPYFQLNSDQLSPSSQHY